MSATNCAICRRSVKPWEPHRWVTHEDGEPKLVHIACEAEEKSGRGLSAFTDEPGSATVRETDRGA